MLTLAQVKIRDTEQAIVTTVVVVQPSRHRSTLSTVVVPNGPQAATVYVTAPEQSPA